MDYNNSYNYGQQVHDPRQEIASCVESAFGKGLAATIMAWFPVTSIISIFLGHSALSLNAQAQELGTYYGVEVPGKNIAAKVLGKVGKIGGIAMTAFYAFYFFYIIFIFALAFA